MSFVLLDPEIIAGPLRLTTTSNETSLEMEADGLDSTVFGLNGWKRIKAGLKMSAVDSSGFWDPAPLEAGALGPDADLWGRFATALPFIISPSGGDLATAYIVPAVRTSLSFLGKVGEITPYSAKALGDGAAARGALIHPVTTVETTSGTGSTFILGTIPEGRKLYVSIHVLSLGGTSPQLTVDVERDDNAGFTTSTAVASLGPVGVPTAALTTVAGPITPDDRYRASWTLTGTAPTARFAVAVGST